MMASSRPVARRLARLLGVGTTGGIGTIEPERRQRVRHDLGHGLADGLCLRADLGVEERLSDDLEGEPHHRLGGVERLAVAPRSDGPRGAIGHRLRVGGDALERERRRDEPPLARVNLALAGQKPVAEERAQEERQSERLGEGVVLRLEDVVREVRGAHEEQIEVPMRILAASGYERAVRS